MVDNCPSVCLPLLLKSFSRRLHHICQTIWNELTDWRLAIYWHKTLWFNRDKRYQINHVQRAAADADGDGSLRVSAWLLKRCVIHSFLGPQYLHMLLTNWPAIKPPVQQMNPPVRLAYTKIFATNVCWDCHLLDDRQRRGVLTATAHSMPFLTDVVQIKKPFDSITKTT